MHRPKLSEINLNLLLALDALLREQSVSRAASRVGISQPAMSQSLRQLRAIFADSLLVKERNRMVLTPAAEALAIPLRHALIQLQYAIDGGCTFDPATAQHRFTVVAGDYVAVTLLPVLLERISAEAPGVGIDVISSDVDRIQDLLATGEADIRLGANLEDTAEMATQMLYDSSFACAARRDHPHVQGELDLEQYLSLPHALISPRGGGVGVVDSVLAALGKRRHIALRLPSFLAAPLVVARSDLILTAPARIVAEFARTHSLQLIDPPLELPTFSIVQAWHRRHERDPAHQWLRQAIAASAASAAP